MCVCSLNAQVAQLPALGRVDRASPFFMTPLLFFIKDISVFGRHFANYMSLNGISRSRPDAAFLLRLYVWENKHIGPFMYVMYDFMLECFSSVSDLLHYYYYLNIQFNRILNKKCLLTLFLSYWNLFFSKKRNLLRNKSENLVQVEQGISFAFFYNQYSIDIIWTSNNGSDV